MAARWLTYIREIARRRQVAGEIDDELAFHLEQEIEAGVQRGLSPLEARRVALRDLGGMAQSRESARDARMTWLDDVAREVRHAVRSLLRAPGFTFVVVLTLALGIGANTALFSIFSSLILRPLPVRDPGSLALLTNGSWSYPVWQQIEAREPELYDGALGWSAQNFDLSSGGKSDLVYGAYVTGGFFDVLGVKAVRGRMLTPADDAGAAPDGPVIVISHRLWRQRFGGADSVLGNRMTVERVPFTIVGVMPAGFFGADVGRTADVMLPFAGEPLIRGAESWLTSADSSWIQIVVRLRPDLDIEQVNAALRAAQPEILATVTGSASRSEPLTLGSAATGNSALRRRFEVPLFAMVVAVGLVLLVACANIAGLLLARTLSRRRELSVRLALGSSRWRLARLLLIESLSVAAGGAAFGLVFASWGSALLVRQLNTWQNPVSLDLAFDWRVLGFTAALACLSAIIASVAPVFWLKDVTPADALTEAGRAMAGDRRFVVRSTLVVAQIAVSLVLVVGAGLFLRTFASLYRVPLGFVPEPLLVAELNLQAGSGPPEERGPRVERLRSAAAAVPGVRSVSVARQRILSGAGTGWSSGRIGIGDGDVSVVRPGVWLNATTPGWFETMGTPIKSGRDFQDGDRLGSSPVVIVNEAFVRRFMPGQQPVGQHVRAGRDAVTRYEIVGVAADAVYTTPREGMLATMYFPLAQQSPKTFPSTVLLIINAPRELRAAVEGGVAAALTQTDPTVGSTFGTFDQLVEATVAQERLIAMLSAFLGGLALLLAAVGLYGVVAHAVRTRQSEIGLRMALGATASGIMRLVLRRVGVLLVAGLGVGLVGSLWASRFVETLLFQLQTRDPITFTAAAVMLVVVGVLAAWVPARRAARLDPARVLREA